jgi:hypothetical protein
MSPARSPRCLPPLRPLSSEKPAGHCPEQQAELRRERDVGGEADDDAKREAGDGPTAIAAPTLM